jgi:hypothetical protein
MPVVLFGTGPWQRLCGQRIEEEENRSIARTRLFGQKTTRLAVVLQFAHLSQRLEPQLIPGTHLSGELVFFPGAFSLRAIVNWKSSQELSRILS